MNIFSVIPMTYLRNSLIDIELIDISFEGNYNSGEKYKTLI